MQISKRGQIIYNVFKNKGLIGLKNLIRNGIDYFFEPTKVGFSPVFIQIEPTTACNLKCRLCINPNLERTRKHLTYEEFFHIIEQFPFLEKISLVGAGEPLMCPDLFEMIGYAKKKRIEIGFATNGILLNNNNIDKIFNLEVDWLNISVDGSTKDIYERIRDGGDFEILKNNIKSLIKKINLRKKPEVSIWFLWIGENFENLPNMINLCKDIGIRKFCVQSSHFWGSESLKKREEYKSIVQNKKLNEFLLKTAEIAEKKDIEFEYVNIPDTSGKRACKWPWRACYITVEGYVTPCCEHGCDPEKINFGNIFREDFKTIWNGVDYVNFRRRIKSFEPPEICVDCPSYFEKQKLKNNLLTDR